MATVALTADTFEQTVAGDGIVLVDFWAGWSSPPSRASTWTTSAPRSPQRPQPPNAERS